MNLIRPITFYLPQFHPIPENDEWWGKGFTEWTNVTKAKPLFKGHYQPHLPADLGFYDLRNIETIEEQANYARSYGIYGFMFYHYWFNGKRLLNTPVDNILKYKKPDFPFMLCWANENWTRRWDGMDKEILIAQEYSHEDDKQHMTYLCEHIFSDDRYIKIDGKPVFALYRSNLLPNIKQTTKIWRETATAFGYKDLYLLKIEGGTDGDNPIEIGFDAAVEFQPDWKNLPKRIRPNMINRILHKLRIKETPFNSHLVYEYADLVKNALVKKLPTYKYYRCITPGWDNSARKKTGSTIFVNSSPELYNHWLNEISKSFTPYSEEENFLFINAWNEWAEGNHLEPCQKWGTKYLIATKNVLKDA